MIETNSENLKNTLGTKYVQVFGIGLCLLHFAGLLDTG